MRELVYLSQAKLQQFVPDEPPWWKKLGRRATIQATTPVGTIGLQAQPLPAPSDIPTADLRAVIAEIEISAVWSGDPHLAPGQWVQFEALMNCVVLRSLTEESWLPKLDQFDAMSGAFVLFVERPIQQDAKPVLVLHGSRRHLIGESHPDLDAVAPRGGFGPSGSLGMLDFLEQFPEPSGLDRKPPPRAVRGDVQAGFDHMMRKLGTGGYLRAETAEWLAGYARVTVAGRYGVVLATPLYVQRVSPP